MNYVTFCKNYYAVTGIPTNLITEAGAIYSALSEQLHISTESPYPLYPSDYNPGVCISRHCIWLCPN